MAGHWKALGKRVWKDASDSVGLGTSGKVLGFLLIQALVAAAIYFSTSDWQGAEYARLLIVAAPFAAFPLLFALNWITLPIRMAKEKAEAIASLEAEKVRADSALAEERAARAVPSVDQRVTTIAQSGGIAAHTYVNEAPKPTVKFGTQKMISRKAGHYQHELDLTVVTPYPARELQVTVYGRGITKISMRPDRPGAFSFGPTGYREDHAFTTLQSPIGNWTIVVEATEPGEVRYVYDIE